MIKESYIREWNEFVPWKDILMVEQVRYALAKFEDLGFIKREGVGKGTKYRKMIGGL